MNPKPELEQLGVEALAYATRLGWTEDTGESALRYLTRMHYAMGFRAARRSPHDLHTCWAVVWPDNWLQAAHGNRVLGAPGAILADTKFESEEEAWQVALGWPSADEIAYAKKMGVKVVRVTILQTD